MRDLSGYLVDTKKGWPAVLTTPVLRVTEMMTGGIQGANTSLFEIWEVQRWHPKLWFSGIVITQRIHGYLHVNFAYTGNTHHTQIMNQGNHSSNLMGVNAVESIATALEDADWQPWSHHSGQWGYMTRRCVCLGFSSSPCMCIVCIVCARVFVRILCIHSFLCVDFAMWMTS